MQTRFDWLIGFGKNIAYFWTIRPLVRGVSRIFIPRNQNGKDLRVFGVVMLIALIAMSYLYPTPINETTKWLNEQKNTIAQKENLPLKQYGFDQWLQKWNIPQIAVQDMRLGLDLQGGIQLTYAILTDDLSESDRLEATESLLTSVTNRVNGLGVNEPNVYVEEIDNKQQLIIELAGITDLDEAIKIIGQTPELEFYRGRSQDEVQELLNNLSEQDITNTSNFENIFFEGEAVLDGGDLEKSSVVFDPTTGQPLVQVTFDREGGKKFETLTEESIGQQIYIVLDGAIQSAPTVNEVISGGNAIITGDFTIEQAQAIVESLNAGALPVPIQLESQQRVEASLGRESLNLSIRAGIIGFSLVALYMIMIYRLPGVIAILALGIYSIFTLATFKLLGFTLTLAGITGFIVSIGLAVDGNILIFERMKEELRKGHTLEGAMRVGFSRAWPSIRDSQVSTLISAGILFYLSSGLVRGFGITLALGSIYSMITAVSFSRLALKICTRLDSWKGMMGWWMLIPRKNKSE